MLTLDWLMEQGACAEGRQWFAAHYPDGVTQATAEGFVDALLREHPNWARWLVIHTPLWTEYQRQAAPLWAEYQRQAAPLWEEYQRQAAALCRAMLCQWLATPTPPSPRAVLARALEAARMYGAEGANAGDLDIPCDHAYTEDDEDTLDLERDYLAALTASGDAPLAVSRQRAAIAIAELMVQGDSGFAIDIAKHFVQVVEPILIAPLAAQLAAARAENDALRKAVVEMAIPYEALRMDDASRKWIAPSVWWGIVEATETARRTVNVATPARPTDTGRDR